MWPSNQCCFHFLCGGHICEGALPVTNMSAVVAFGVHAPLNTLFAHRCSSSKFLGCLQQRAENLFWKYKAALTEQRKIWLLRIRFQKDVVSHCEVWKSPTAAWVTTKAVFFSHYLHWFSGRRILRCKRFGFPAKMDVSSKCTVFLTP